MSTFKATFGGVVVLIATLAMIAFAQAQSKSSPVTSLEEGEAIYVGKNGTVHKRAAKHETALKRGAVELSGPTVMYHQGGRMYMYGGAAAGTNAAEDFQDQFDVSY